MRNDNINILFETLQILDQGWYEAGDQKIQLKLSREEMEEARVILPHELETMAENPKDTTPLSLCRCSYSCENVDSFSSALKMTAERGTLMAEDKPVLVLNMANPVHPGGGVRHGAKAQEEDLCRRSSLLVSLEGPKAAPYYEYNRRVGTYMGSDAMISFSEC